MAAIGKIRSWGPVLAVVIGLALFAFIAEEAVHSCESSSNAQRQQVGEVLGEKISYQDLQAQVDEFQEYLKVTQNRDNFSEEEQNRVKDAVWGNLVQNKILENEAAKLGLTVTDDELKNILTEGTNPMLAQTPFVNQQTGRFDASQLKQFLNNYNTYRNSSDQQQRQAAQQMEPIYRYWKYTEKQLRQQLLAVKYQNLLNACLISNPISAKAAFDAQNTEREVIVASLPYNTINDTTMQVTEAELKAKYNEQKEQYRQMDYRSGLEVETRDIKYVAFQVVPSAADRQNIQAQMEEARQNLISGEGSLSELVRKAQSQVAYVGLPVTKASLPSDISAKLEGLAVGETTEPFETRYDNTLNVVKLIAKTQLPDSIEFRSIFIGGADNAEAALRADSVLQAIKGGASFETIAQTYGQEGQTQWMTSDMYQGAPSIDADTKNYIQSLNAMAVNELRNVTITQGNIILQVTARRSPVEKFDVAVIKRPIVFSDQTYSDAYNKFSQYVSENTTLDQLEQNAAQNGFQVLERNDLASSEHTIANIRGTRDALKWVFESKPGQVSPLYECGNNDRLLVVALTAVHPVGYRSLSNVTEIVRPQVIRDKKYAHFVEQMNGVKSIEEAKAKGASVDTLNQITFSASAYVPATGGREYALSGAIAAQQPGTFSPKLVKGSDGAYLFQVVGSAQREGVQYDQKLMEMQLQQQGASFVMRSFMQDLYKKAKVVDNRYIFF